MVDAILGIYHATIGSVDEMIAVSGERPGSCPMAVSDDVSVVGPVVEC